MFVKKSLTKPQTRETENLNGKRKRKNKEIKIGDKMSWNTLSLYHAGVCQTLTEVLRQYTVLIAALQKVRWTGKSQIKIDDYII